MMDEKCTSDMSEEEGQEEGDGGKSEPPKTCFQHQRAASLRKYILKFDVFDNTMVVFSYSENKICKWRRNLKVVTSFNEHVEKVQ
jgi:hypothetical protein